MATPGLKKELSHPPNTPLRHKDKKCPICPDIILESALILKFVGGNHVIVDQSEMNQKSRSD